MGKLNHIALILDGNGRWAKERKMPRTYGHTAGAKNVEVICRAAARYGVKYLTMYAFSTENWKRSKQEVDALFSLFSEYLTRCIKLSKENNMRVRIIGDKSPLSDSLKEKIAVLEKESAAYDGLNLNIAINYGSRDEICRAIKKIKADTNVSVEDIDEDLVSRYLDTADIPDPDLLIRTGGDQRLSNYLLWQLCYTEFMFVDCYWPDFDEKKLSECIENFGKRDRRFGNA